MAIMMSQNILNCIKDELSHSTESFLLISAYCKLPLVKYFDSCITCSGIDKRLVVRLRLEDILSNASDLAIYPYCRDNGWKFYFRLDLHAKTYVFDRLRGIVGSANATSNGMSIGGTGNYELATVCELQEADLRLLDQLILGAVEMTDSLYGKMLDIVNRCQVRQERDCSWPKEIVDMFTPDYSVLFAEDFPTCAHPSHARADDLMFLNLEPGASLDDISCAFRSSKCYQWLLNLLRNKEGNQMYFGELTASLHNTLLNEPKPYRKDIKQLLSNLLNWIAALDMDELLIDRPTHSQRVRYR